MRKLKKIITLAMTTVILSMTLSITAFADGNPFSDINPGDWYYNDVIEIYNDGLMTGCSGTNKFKPNDTLTREQFAVILYRREDNPSITYQKLFHDVQPGNWYTDACVWSGSTGLITGYGNGYFEGYDFGTFGVGKNITREQVATILYRYAERKWQDTSLRADLSRFSDAESVSDWAENAISWCVAAGIITGKNGGKYLAPGDFITRAECATIINRFKHFETPNSSEYKFLAIGNSMTKLGVISGKWFSDSAMAASVPENDWFHLVTAWLKNKKGDVSSMAVNYAVWERNDNRASTYYKIDSYLRSDLNLVTIELAENVTRGYEGTFKRDFEALILHIKEKAPNAQIIILDNFWGNQTIETSTITAAAKKEIADKYGLRFVDLSEIRENPFYQAGMGAAVYGDDGSIHYIDMEIRAKHPGDAGFAYMANAVISNIR